MQRLFTTFANGLPGFGLLIQRLVMAIVLLLHGVLLINEAPASGLIVPKIAGAVLGLFILVGLWTPVTGALIAAIQVWIAFAGAGDASLSIILAVLGGTLAMIGPGAWSIDARIFGRKHIAS